MNLKINQFRMPSFRNRKRKKSKQNSRNLRNTNNCTKICVMGFPEDRKKAGIIFEDMRHPNFPNLMKTKSSTTPRWINSKISKPRHIIIKLPREKDKDRILKTVKEKHSYKRSSIRITADFSTKTIGVSRQ